MLKIKDNVDLKELEKFGLVKVEDCYIWRNKYDVVCIEISIINRKIWLTGDKNANIIFYDLIKADLVEKVEV